MGHKAKYLSVALTALLFASTGSAHAQLGFGKLKEGAGKVGGGIKGFVTGSGDAVAAAGKAIVDVKEMCFAPPSKTFTDGNLSIVERQIRNRRYNANQKNYEICRLKTPGKQFVASAELSKLSLVKMADAVSQIAEAKNLKLTEINEYAERLRATPAYQLDMQSEANNLNTQLAALSAEEAARGEIPLTDDLKVKIQLASETVATVGSYWGQSIGAMWYLGDNIHHTPPQYFVSEVSTLYGAQFNDAAGEQIVNDAVSNTFGLVKNGAGLIGTVIQLGEVEDPVQTDEVKAALNQARTVSNQELAEIVQKVDSGSLI